MLFHRAMCIECIRFITFNLWSLVRTLPSCKSRNIWIPQASLGGFSQHLSVVRSGLRELFQYILCCTILEPLDSRCVDVHGWSLSKQFSIQLPRVRLYCTCLTVSSLKLLCVCQTFILPLDSWAYDTRGLDFTIVEQMVQEQKHKGSHLELQA